MLPNQVQLSEKATNKMQYIKSKTGLTPNISSRIAIMLAMKEGSNLKNAELEDMNGQVLNKGVLFGEHLDVYDVLINQYMHENEIDLGIRRTIASLVEIGVHKMGHIKSLSDVCKLK